MANSKSEIRAHFTKFIDKIAYPDYVDTDEKWNIFFKFQSKGRARITDSEYESIKPLIHAQESKEKTIKMTVEECADFWANNWGWYIPLMHTIRIEFAERHTHKDVIFIRALIKIARRCKEEGFGVFLAKYTGITEDAKDAIFIRKYGETLWT